MSQREESQEAQQLPPVLKASVHDVRYFAALLRGVNFVNRGTVTITKTGFVVVVEEARTLLGTAYIFADIFDEYTYNSESPSAPQDSQNSDPEEEDNAAFEIPLNTLVECLNIFGTAGPSASATNGPTSKFKKWKKAGDNSDGDDNDDDGDARGRKGRQSKENGIDQYFSSSTEKGTGMRMTYAGSGYPLTLLMQDAAGPTTKCEITTYDAEPHLQLPFESDRILMIVKGIKNHTEGKAVSSSWLRDALSELDPSCDKLTFIGNPPPSAATSKQRQQSGTPMLRIQAAGTFGSTEMDYPNDRDVLETFECTRPISFTYRFGHISRTLRALQSSAKTSLRIDDEGLMSLQFLMPSPKAKIDEPSTDGFIEFRCLALDDEV
ncbi:Rad1/Rec1/Rad17 [Mycena rebaudengoi]|nr:Rad1/Rec1/Rad17 [Mycena rebaudengoi]